MSILGKDPLEEGNMSSAKVLPSSAKPSKASASAEFSPNLKLLLPPHRKSSNSAGSEHSLHSNIVMSQQ